MLVSELGEFGLIRRLSERLGVRYAEAGSRARSGLLVELGDDAVVGDRRDGALIWTTDTLVAGVHFLPERTAWQDVGWKALAVNLSDVAAMGGTPYLALVTLALPPESAVEDADALYDGLLEAARRFEVLVAGGDIVRSPVFGITVALSGWADLPRLGQPRCMTRAAARPGDVIAVSGTLGGSAGGLRLLKDGALLHGESEQRLRRAHERPCPRVALGRAAVRAGVRCAIDVSDGLVQDLGHVAAASHTGIRIDAARVPVNEDLAAVFPQQALGLALSGGEDYELALVAARPVIEALLSAGDVPLTEIGEVVDYDGPRVSIVDESGREIPLGTAGWDHFTSS